VFYAQGKLDEAIRYYRSALRLDASDPAVHVGMSRALTAQGKRDEAISHYETALAILKAGPKQPASGASIDSERRP
jgi:tetratricopeptide (TPR) repeat protein